MEEGFLKKPSWLSRKLLRCWSRSKQYSHSALFASTNSFGRRDPWRRHHAIGLRHQQFNCWSVHHFRRTGHDLITCTAPYACPARPMFTSRRVRGWKKLDCEEFQKVLSDGPLCQDEEYYAGMSASELFDLYSTTIWDTLDCLAPLHVITSRHNPSTPWFDADSASPNIGRSISLSVRSQTSGTSIGLSPYHGTKDPVHRQASTLG